MAQQKNEEKETPKESTDHDFGLGEPYNEIASEKIYSDKTRVGKIFAAKDGIHGNKFLRLLSESNIYNKRERKSDWKKTHGFNLYETLHVDKLIAFLRKYASVVGWKIKENEDTDKLKADIQEMQQQIVQYRENEVKIREDQEQKIAILSRKLEERSKKEMPKFKKDLDDFQKMMNQAKSKSVPEASLQDFLYSHSWMFGLEYVAAEPQKLRGAHSRFDFFLQRFNGTNDIVEIKLVSDEILLSDGTISSKVIQGVDQLIEYMEATTAVAHSTVLSNEEEIYELRPKGILIIGCDCSPKALEKLEKWNYQFAHITIMTYEQLIQKSKTAIEKFEELQRQQSTPST